MTMKNLPELVAPVGSVEALRAAVENGADAVYLGGKKFGARHFAANFTEREMKRAARYIHSKDARLFVTVNTLVKDSEIAGLIEYLDFLRDIEVDAVVVQDLGVLGLIRERFPDLRVHASTQMNVHNSEGVRFLTGLGVKRVVLARELDIMQIGSIFEKTGSELEVFVHGALCYSYSGNCLFSSLISGRSANRGRCVQACRMKFTIENNEIDVSSGHLLSLKDLCSAEMLPELVDAGVAAFKIEGRMKRPEYVAVVVGIYRRLLDRIREGNFYITWNEKRDLLQIFNRGFTKGYLRGERGGMVNPVSCDNRGLEIGRVTGVSESGVEIKLSTTLCAGDGIEIIVGGKTVGRRIKADLTRGGTLKIGLKDTNRVPINSAVYRTSDAQLISRARKSYERR